MGKDAIFKPFFVVFTVLIFGSIGFSEDSNFFEADATSGSPLDAFQNYRDDYGISNARLDMEDNGVIDNSIESLEFENFNLDINTVPIKS